MDTNGQKAKASNSEGIKNFLSKAILMNNIKNIGVK